MLIQLDSGRQQSVDFDTRDEADAAADTLMKQMKAEVVDVVKVAGLSTVVLKTEDVETIHVHEVP
jgi:hypothetical protein